MRWYARELGYGEEEDFWGIVGLLHDIDFEQYPEQHCVKAPELLRPAGVGEDMIRSICSHGYGICSDCTFLYHYALLFSGFYTFRLCRFNRYFIALFFIC